MPGCQTYRADASVIYSQHLDYLQLTIRLKADAFSRNTDKQGVTEKTES